MAKLEKYNQLLVRNSNYVDFYINSLTAFKPIDKEAMIYSPNKKMIFYLNSIYLPELENEMIYIFLKFNNGDFNYNIDDGKSQKNEYFLGSFLNKKVYIELKWEKEMVYKN